MPSLDTPPPSPASGVPPTVSVTLAAYRSHETLAACLDALRRQTFRDFEVVVVDSSPDDASERLVRERYPEVRLVHSRRRLLPHAARNRGVAESRGRLLIFFDPDVYAEPDCLQRLVDAHRESGQPVVGALECFGERWLDVGIHVCKFSKWLPGGATRAVDMGPTAHLLVDRVAVEEVGGFRDDHFLADALFSWRLLETGRRLVFEPRAVVAHHHLSTLRDFLRERFRRGIQFARLRSEWFGHSRRRDLLFAVASLGLLRLPRIAALVFGHCRGAGRARAFFTTAPLWVAGHVASLLGEGGGHLARALRRSRRASGAQGGAPVAKVEPGAAQ